MTRQCRCCGCSDHDACLPPCWWVDTDLCSTCNTTIESIAEAIQFHCNGYPIDDWPAAARDAGDAILTMTQANLPLADALAAVHGYQLTQIQGQLGLDSFDAAAHTAVVVLESIRSNQ